MKNNCFLEKKMFHLGGKLTRNLNSPEKVQKSSNTVKYKNVKV